MARRARVPADQLGMFGREEPSFDRNFEMLHRTDLGRGAWFDYAPAWFRGHESLFSILVGTAHWRAERREMYDRVVDVPRLYAELPVDGAVLPIIEQVRVSLSERYRARFERISLGYYRSGRDSVAWHGDYVAREMFEALVATISLGAPRRFLLRPTGGGASLGISLGWGDLFVMGGTCQRTFQHCVPKVESAPPRIALMFRPDW